MKNADLVVVDHFNGQTVAGQLDFSQFAAPSDMTLWEMAAYRAYGDAKCETERIDTLADLFGQEFSDRFFTHKNRLLVRKRLEAAKRRLANEQAAVTAYEAFLDNPGPNMPDWVMPFPDEQ